MTPEPPADQERCWVETHRAIVERAFEVFMETGDWPKVQLLRRWFAQQHNDTDVQAVADGRPGFPGEMRTVHQEYVSLMVRHLRHLPLAAAVVNLCIVITQQAAVVYRTADAELRVSSTDVDVAAASAGDARLLARAGALLFAEQPSPLAGGGPVEDGWQYYINESIVLDFEHVSSADDFVAVQDRILEERFAQRQQTGYSLPSAFEPLDAESLSEILDLSGDEFEVPVGTIGEATEQHPRAFISHASEDKERFVTEFATRLRASGIDAWIDRWEIAPGQSLVARIFDEGIKDAVAFIIVLSSYSIDKPWVVKELNAGVIENIERGCRLIPVVLDGIQPPLVLKDHLWVSVADLESYDVELRKIVLAIFGVADKPPLGPVPSYIAQPARIQGLNAQDAQVLAALARTALDSPFGRPNHEAALAECKEAGLDEGAFELSLEALDKADLIDLQRQGGGFIAVFGVQQSGFVRYLEVTRPDLPALRRQLVALLVNEFSGGANLTDLAERLEEPQMLVRVLLEELQRRRMLQLVRTNGGTSVFDISALLERELS